MRPYQVVRLCNGFMRVWGPRELEMYGEHIDCILGEADSFLDAMDLVAEMLPPLPSAEVIVLAERRQ